jgi:hypothetical protein
MIYVYGHSDDKYLLSPETSLKITFILRHQEFRREERFLRCHAHLCLVCLQLQYPTCYPRQNLLKPKETPLTHPTTTGVFAEFLKSFESLSLSFSIIRI